MAEKVTFIKDGAELDVEDTIPLPVTPGSKPVGVINRVSLTIGATVAVTLFAASPKRKVVVISNLDPAQSVFIKFQDASVDNLKNDICLKSSDPPFTMKAIDGPIYLGEISVIADLAGVDVSAIEINEQ